MADASPMINTGDAHVALRDEDVDRTLREDPGGNATCPMVVLRDDEE